jgi:hypothetical protein
VTLIRVSEIQDVTHLQLVTRTNTLQKGKRVFAKMWNDLSKYCRVGSRSFTTQLGCGNKNILIPS